MGHGAVHWQFPAVQLQCNAVVAQGGGGCHQGKGYIRIGRLVENHEHFVAPVVLNEGGVLEQKRNLTGLQKLFPVRSEGQVASQGSRNARIRLLVEHERPQQCPAVAFLTMTTDDSECRAIRRESAQDPP